MDAPEELRLTLAQAFMEAWWANSLHAPVDWDRMTAAPCRRELSNVLAHAARQAYLDGIDAVLAVPAVADALARDAKVAEWVKANDCDPWKLGERVGHLHNPALWIEKTP